MQRKCLTAALIWYVAIVGTVATCLAGLDTTTGRERDRWTEDRYSVIVARVADISPVTVTEENGTHQAILEPLVALAGSVDPSAHPKLHVTLYADGMTSSIRSAPSKGSLVLAVLQGTTFVVSDICTFMPERMSLVVLKGLDDPRVTETLRKIQEARAHPEPDASGKPATRAAR